MSKAPSEGGNDPDREESEINERLDRVINLLATYLP
jgi:hypothetical protein